MDDGAGVGRFCKQPFDLATSGREDGAQADRFLLRQLALVRRQGFGEHEGTGRAIRATGSIGAQAIKSRCYESTNLGGGGEFCKGDVRGNAEMLDRKSVV